MTEEPREPAPTLKDAIAELKRELKLRENCYPGWIKKGTIDRVVARKQYARMLCALKILMKLEEEQSSGGSRQAGTASSG